MEMFEMRVLVAAILIVSGIASVRAADLPTDQHDSYSTLAVGFGHRSGPLTVYDYQPGVLVRAYWLAPWRHRHYFPTTGEMPEIGRDEDLSAPSNSSEPAETFHQHWSTSSAFLSEQPRRRARPLEAERPLNPAPLK
jgi:hypothetical protein